MKIKYASQRISADEMMEFLSRSDLGLQYPKERFRDRIEKLVKSTSISITAKDSDKIVGIIFALSDFSYWMFVTDFGVDREYVHKGIGSELMKRAHEEAGGERDIAVYLVANDKAIPFYEKLGMKKSEDVMEYNKIEWTNFKVEI